MLTYVYGFSFNLFLKFVLHPSENFMMGPQTLIGPHLTQYGHKWLLKNFSSKKIRQVAHGR